MRPISDYINDLRTKVLPETCPFAADAWDAGLVAVGICDGLDAVTDALDFYPASGRDVFICVLPDVEGLSPADLSSYVEDKNEGLVAEDMWLMAYHPDNNPVVSDYTLIFVHQLSKLTAASYTLKQQGYYECPHRKTYHDLVHRRNEKAIQHGKFRTDDI